MASSCTKIVGAAAQIFDAIVWVLGAGRVNRPFVPFACQSSHSTVSGPHTELCNCPASVFRNDTTERPPFDFCARHSIPSVSDFRVCRGGRGTHPGRSPDSPGANAPQGGGRTTRDRAASGHSINVAERARGVATPYLWPGHVRAVSLLASDQPGADIISAADSKPKD